MSLRRRSTIQNDHAGHNLSDNIFLRMGLENSELRHGFYWYLKHIKPNIWHGRTTGVRSAIEEMKDKNVMQQQIAYACMPVAVKPGLKMNVSAMGVLLI